MKYLLYFIVPFLFFFVVWSTIHGIIQGIRIATSSGSTVTAFVFGGIISPIICLVLLILWYHLSEIRAARNKKQRILRSEKREETDKVLDTYIEAVSNAPDLETINVYSNDLRRTDEHIKKRYKLKGLKDAV